jgi:hypothetical protein
MLDLKSTIMDIKGAYLNGILDEEIYMRQPEGFSDGTDKVLRLRKTLYGLKQSGRVWNRRLRSYLQSIGFTQLIMDTCIYIRLTHDGFDIIATWVDDLYILCTTDKRLLKVKSEINSEFEATDQGEPKLLLGIEIDRNYPQHSIKITQTQYILRMLSRFNMADARPVATPLPSGIQYQPSTDDDAFEDQSLYRSAIGSLMYAAIGTRPDIAYAVNTLSQFNVKPSQAHWNAVKHVLRYLKGTADYGILYDMNSGYSSFDVSAFSDADNGKSWHKKAITGGVLLLAGGAIKWIAEKQPTITLSTMEAEYVAANSVTRAVKWLRQLIEELGFIIRDPVALFIDNQTAIRISENPELHRKSQHIDKQFHWIREQIEEGIISANWVPGEENLADIFTKSLPATRFSTLRTYLGILG